MKIVIDIGAARYGGDHSIEHLVAEFNPDLLYAFDPNPALTDKPAGEVDGWIVGGTTVFAERLAAWTYRGKIGYQADGLNSWISDDPAAPQVECFDLADFILRRPAGSEIILKLDCEGSEYDLLRRVIATGADKMLKLAWVEWHEPDRGRAQITDEISCELREWLW